MTEDRVVMISGASRGIGAVTAKILLAAGWRVSIGVRGGACPDWAQNYPSDQLHHFSYTAGPQDSERKWVAAAYEHFGRIDVVVASAGIASGTGVLAISDDEIRQMMEVNVLAPRRLAAAAWDALAQRKRGRIVILGSLSGKRVKSAGAGAYALSKFAAVALSHALRQEGYAQGIRTTVICPSFVATDMARALTATDTQLMTQPEDIARLIMTVLDLPNEASVAELIVNCSLEPQF